jgi:glucose/arabinose dehydrogenase
MMKAYSFKPIARVLAVALVLGIGAGPALAQRGGLPVEPLGDGPWEFPTAEAGTRIEVSVVTRGLSHPWDMAFLPNGDILVTERSGQLRIIRNGTLDPEPISGDPTVHAVRLSGLMDVELHPNFDQNQYVYLTYTKNLDPDPLEVATTVARGRLVGNRLEDVEDILVADSWPGNGGSGSRIVFGPDGYLYMSTGASNGNAAQDPSNLRGKILRLTDDGRPAPGNPFEGRPGYAPEVFSMGHRNSLGLAFHPVTGQLWNSEMGPNGGDEVNIIEPGANYGWPDISFGRTYEGPPVSPIPWREGITLPVAFFVPGISPSGLSFYSGSRIPAWSSSVFIGALRVGQVPGTAHLVRLFFDENGHERRREALLADLGQRIRDIKEGPDGYIYLLTEEDDAALLRIAPAN